MYCATSHRDVRVAQHARAADIFSWEKWIEALQRLVRSLGTLLERLQTEIDNAAEAVDADPANVPPRVRTHRPTYTPPKGPLPSATSLACADSGHVVFAVSNVEYRVQLSALRLALLLRLSAPTSADGELVASKPMAWLVSELRSLGFRATARSVAVELSRLRGLLGPGNGLLIERSGRARYRFRLLHSAAVDLRVRSPRAPR